MADVNYRLLPSSKSIKINNLEDSKDLEELSLSEPGIINLDEDIDFNMEYNNYPDIESLNKNYNVFKVKDKVEDLGCLNDYLDRLSKGFISRSDILKEEINWNGASLSEIEKEIMNINSILASSEICNKKIKKKVAKDKKRLYNGIDTDILDII